MKTIAKYVLIIFLFPLFLPLAYAQSLEGTLDTTALNLLIKINPLADITTDRNKENIAILRNELQVLFDDYLTEEGKILFYLPTPFEMGKILIQFTEDVREDLEPLFDENGDIDLTNTEPNLPQLNELNHKYQAIKLSKKKYLVNTYDLFISDQYNPHRVAKEYKDLEQTNFAVANWTLSFNSETSIKRVRAYPIVYIFSYRWENCPEEDAENDEEDCQYERRYYAEVSGAETKGVTRIGETGDVLLEEQRLFLRK